jgi:hypothetical protein
MKITKEMPVSGTKRTRKVYAYLPTYFHHGSINNPLRTMVWLDYYLVDEYYEYDYWHFSRRRLDDSVSSQTP